MKRSCFITFEGVDSCGKSTQAKLLKKYFEDNDIPILLTREPGGTVISEKIRDIILNPDYIEMTAETELLLYLASRNQHTKQVIIPSIEKGINVICDRYIDSTTIYQGHARNLEIALVDKMNLFATNGLKPDITFIIDISVDLINKRLQGKLLDRLEKENYSFHEKVRESYLELSKTDDRFVVIDGTKEIDEIQNIIIEKINEIFKETL